MVRVRNPSTAAVQRIQLAGCGMRWTGRPPELARRNGIARTMPIQHLFGVGLAMQITKRSLPPSTAIRMADHIEQLQSVIRGFRADLTDVLDRPAEPGVVADRNARNGLRNRCGSIPANDSGLSGSPKSGVCDPRRQGPVVPDRP